MTMMCAVRSRVLKTSGVGADVPRLVQLLRHCRELRDYSELLAYLRSISPSALDTQLRSMQVPRLFWRAAHVCPLLWLLVFCNCGMSLSCTVSSVGDGTMKWNIAWAVCASQLLEGGSSLEEVKDMCRLLEFLATEMAANRNFELMQALLRVTMQVRSTIWLLAYSCPVPLLGRQLL